MNPIRVLFSISEADYSSWLKNSYTASLTLADGSTYDASNTGRMDFSDNTINTSTGTIAIRWSFDNDNNTLIPGSAVRITLKPIHEQRAVMVPQEAVLADIDGSYVYIVEGDTAHVRRVKSLGVWGGKTAVDGVKAGELVVEGGTQMVFDGAKVKIQDK